MKNKRFKKGICVFFVALIVVSVVLSFAWKNEAAAAPKEIHLSFGGSTTTTWGYMFCAVLSETWKRHIPDLNITLLATAGSTANYIPLDKGELDLGLGTSGGDWYAMNAMHFTKKRLSNFCSIMPATTAFLHAFTYADSPIKTWRDLNGKRVCIGARATPTSINSEEICKAIGIEPKFVFSSTGEAIQMVKDRRVDAMMYIAGAPWSKVLDVATTQKIKLLSMTPEEQEKVHGAYPHQVVDKIPARTYPFQNEDIRTTMVFQTINVRPGLSNDLVYKLTKVAWEHWDEVVKGAAAAARVKPKDIVLLVPMIHPGAAKYYREGGVQIPDRKVWKRK